MKHNIILIAILFVLFAAFFQGCAQQPDTGTKDLDISKEDTVQPEINSDDSTEQSDISMDEFNMVNDYVKQAGAEEIPLSAAEDMEKALCENSNTQEKKTEWQLVVDYVNNENREKPEDISYTIEFKDSSFTMQGNTWERIGG